MARGKIVRLADSYDTLADAAAIDDYATLLCVLLGATRCRWWQSIRCIG